MTAGRISFRLLLKSIHFVLVISVFTHQPVIVLLSRVYTRESCCPTCCLVEQHVAVDIICCPATSCSFGQHVDYLCDIITIHLCHGRLVSLCIQQQTGNKLATILLMATSNMLTGNILPWCKRGFTLAYIFFVACNMGYCNMLCFERTFKSNIKRVCLIQRFRIQPSAYSVVSCRARQSRWSPRKRQTTDRTYVPVSSLPKQTHHYLSHLTG